MARPRSEASEPVKRGKIGEACSHEEEDTTELADLDEPDLDRREAAQKPDRKPSGPRPPAGPAANRESFDSDRETDPVSSPWGSDPCVPPSTDPA